MSSYLPTPEGEHRLAFVVKHSDATGSLLHISSELVIDDPSAKMWPGLDNWKGASSICGHVSRRTRIAWMLLERWDYWFEPESQRRHDNRPSAICVECFLELLS